MVDTNFIPLQVNPPSIPSPTAPPPTPTDPRGGFIPPQVNPPSVPPATGPAPTTNLDNFMTRYNDWLANYQANLPAANTGGFNLGTNNLSNFNLGTNSITGTNNDWMSNYYNSLNEQFQGNAWWDNWWANSPYNTGSGTGDGTDSGTDTPTTPTEPYQGDVQVVPGVTNPNQPGQINVVDYAGQLIENPSNFFTQDDPNTPNLNESMFLGDHLQGMDPNTVGTNLDPNNPNYQMDPSATNAATNQGTAAQANQVTPTQANSYEAFKSFNDMLMAMMTGAQGSVSQGSLIDPEDVEINLEAMQNNPAFSDWAQLGLSVIDTSTAAGKLLAEQLGPNGYVDSKATLKGQLEMLQKEFVGPNGEPRIPSWAAANAREVSKIMAFKGVSGTAATAAMSQAILEASLPIAQADSQFFQTATLQNLSNEQQSIINKANILAKMELANMDNRMAAAVQNSKHFFEMDMANLSNEQQARVINTQARVQSILEDSKQENAARLFGAEAQNAMDKFYGELNAAINQFNTAQLNSMEQFNTNEANGMNRFNSELENAREQFYKNMQYNIDLANAKWRQTITLQEDEQQFEAAATDVKNMVGLSIEQLNQIWDRSDALLDYIWKSSENEADRKNALAIQTMVSKTSMFNQQAQLDAADNAGLGSLFGTVFGGLFGDSGFVGGLTDFLF